MINTSENHSIELLWDDFVLLQTKCHLTYLSKITSVHHLLSKESDNNYEVFSSREIT